VIYLLDANVIGDLMARHARVEARLAAVQLQHSVRLLTIVEGEVLFGIERLPAGAKRRTLEAATAHVMPKLQRESLPTTAARRFAVIKAECARRGVSLGDNDVWIASAAFELAATLVTRDKDFTRIPGLILDDWTQ
jgi:predicted nucleic acid-binding protein